jgi:hypothetical protein
MHRGPKPPLKAGPLLQERAHDGFAKAQSIFVTNFFYSTDGFGSETMPLTRCFIARSANSNGKSSIMSSKVLVGAGAAWTTTMAMFNVAAQLSVSRWVQGRALSCYQIIMQGAMAGGSALWGLAAGTYGVRIALIIASSTIFIGLLSMIWFQLAGDFESRPGPCTPQNHGTPRPRDQPQQWPGYGHH